MAAAKGGGGKSKASNLPKAVNAKRNTKGGRAKMAPTSFALPGKQYRIDDKAHARNALSRVAQNGTPAQQAHVQRAVKAKFPSINVTGLKSKGKN
jgi:hypothetical protein